MKMTKEWHTKNGCTITRLLGGRSNVFLLSDGKRHILIDTSPGYRWHTLAKRLNSLNIQYIDYLILTHAHFDHAANAAKIRQKYKAKIIVHEEEIKFLTSGMNPAISGTNQFTRVLVRIAAGFFLKRMSYEPCEPDITAGDFFDLKETGINAYIVHTPGHSPGSVSIIVDNEIAIVGDCMFGVIVPSVFPPFAEDIELLMKSWKKLLDTECTTFLPSHGNKRTRENLAKSYHKHNPSEKNEETNL